MNPWVIIAAGGVFEAVWASLLNMSDGLRDPVCATAAVAVTFVSVAFLKAGLKRGVPVGGGYAVWVGFGAVFSTVAGALLFGERLSLAGWLFLAVLIAGVVLLQSPGRAK